MRTGVFGGSFDPPHVGHVLAAKYLLSVGLVDQVLVVPVFAHAHDKPLSPFDTRLRLCDAAFDGESRVGVSAIEADLPRPSYTLRTLEALHRAHPLEQLRLVIGADVLAETDKWYRFGEVANLAPPLVLGRAGVSLPDGPPVVLPQISSTEVRAWVKSGLARDRHRLELSTPFLVRELIDQEGLYR